MKTWIVPMTLSLLGGCGADLDLCLGPATTVCNLDVAQTGGSVWVAGGQRIELEVTANVPKLRPTDGLDVLLIADDGRLGDVEAGQPLEVRAVLSDADSLDTRTARVPYVQPFCRAAVVLALADGQMSKYKAPLAQPPSLVLEVSPIGTIQQQVTVTVDPRDLALGPAAVRLQVSQGQWLGEEVGTSSVTLNLLRFDESQLRRASTTLFTGGPAVVLSAETLGVATELIFLSPLAETLSATSADCVGL